jgi:hypothetical protein
MLSVHCPDLCRAEQHWIVSVLLGDFLGLAHEIRFDDKDTVRIAADGKTLELPAIFVHRAHGHWLSAKTMPAEPLPRWRAPADHFPRAAVGPALPLIFGSGTFERRDNEAVLGLDVFGAGFFMLSRYEEAVSARRDSHQRFPSAASLACREGFLERPIVDEYTEILWLAMQSLWPRLQRRQRRFTTAVTCDVDHPYHASARSLFRLFKRTAGEALRKRTWADGCRPLRNYFGSRKGNWSHDPYYHTVDWMMDVNEAAGNKVSFYFIPEVTDAALDDTCPITEPAVAAMLKRIADRGHEIGIHPGYRTYQDKQRLLAGLYRLREVLHRQRITQPVAGGRQHYLRWSTRTPAIWHEAGLRYDSTLAYADHAGFRCGTSHEYRMYDLHQRRALDVRQRPLICMESSVIGYMGYGFTEAALQKMKALKSAAKAFDGSFTLLWHNSYLEAHSAREMYREIIA